MSIKGFSVGGVVQRYDYTALGNLPQGQGVSDDLKAALLQLAQKVAYIDDQGQTYYDDLYDALYPEKTLLSITANFQQGQAVVYNTDSLDTLKQYLTVTAVYDGASTETVPSSAYTLSGTLTTGTSVITVTYEGKTDAFNVVVTAAPMSFPVTNNLTGCTTSNSASNVAEGSTYNAVITASSDYTLVGATVSITMGGQDITTSAYSGGIITISNVNGALIISVTAVERVLTSISAVYTQSGTVYDTDTLDSLKADLVVTAHYSDSSTQTVPAADYTLSGTLTVGTSTITVSYGGKTTTFSVTVTSLSYVSNGLVMWLDGEKNSTNGAHVSNLTTWVDQSGNGWNFENVGATVNAKSLSFNGKSQYLKRAFDSLPHDVKMMEIVVNRTSGNNVISGFGNNYPGNITFGGTKYLSFQIGTGSGNDKNAGFNLPGDLVGTVISANSAGYINGTSIATQTDSNAWQYRYPCIGGYLGSEGTNFQYGYKGEIYCIRMYNRILTEQEILANFAVDAHRFGIGG